MTFLRRLGCLLRRQHSDRMLVDDANRLYLHCDDCGRQTAGIALPGSRRKANVVSLALHKARRIA
jgi:hypothetical protein